MRMSIRGPPLNNCTSLFPNSYLVIAAGHPFGSEPRSEQLVFWISLRMYLALSAYIESKGRRLTFFTDYCIDWGIDNALRILTIPVVTNYSQIPPFLGKYH